MSVENPLERGPNKPEESEKKSENVLQPEIHFKDITDLEKQEGIEITSEEFEQGISAAGERAKNDSESKEKANDQEVVAHNLKMLKEDMWDLLLSESWGGNAGYTEIGGENCVCAGANGYADPETGRIVAFGNLQDVDVVVQRKNAEFTLLVADHLGGLQIVRLYGNDRFTERGLRNIKKAVNDYNLSNFVKPK